MYRIVCVLILVVYSCSILSPCFFLHWRHINFNFEIPTARGGVRAISSDKEKGGGGAEV